MSLTDQLRALGTHVSPISGHEIGGVLAALVAYAEHGTPILEAAEKGAQAVADFYYDQAAQKAKDDGVDPPRKGAPVEAPPPAGPEAAGWVPATAAEVGLLLQKVQQLTAGLANAQRQAVEAKVVSTDQHAIEPAAEPEVTEPAGEPASAETATEDHPAAPPAPGVFG